MLINCLPLPEDICEEIKGFSFYDTVTARTMLLKEEISNNILNAESLAKVDYGEPDLYLFSAGNVENWSPNVLRNCCHQIIFCLDCGNYWMFSSIQEHDSAIDKVRCKCP